MQNALRTGGFWALLGTVLVAIGVGVLAYAWAGTLPHVAQLVVQILAIVLFVAASLALVSLGVLAFMRDRPTDS